MCVVGHAHMHVCVYMLGEVTIISWLRQHDIKTVPIKWLFEFWLSMVQYSRKKSN